MDHGGRVPFHRDPDLCVAISQWRDNSVTTACDSDRRCRGVARLVSMKTASRAAQRGEPWRRSRDFAWHARCAALVTRAALQRVVSAARPTESPPCPRVPCSSPLPRAAPHRAATAVHRRCCACRRRRCRATLLPRARAPGASSTTSRPSSTSCAGRSARRARRCGPERARGVAMLTSAFTTASLLPKSGAVRTAAVPLAVVHRPQVLARPHVMPQQLSLFGPPGAIRR